MSKSPNLRVQDGWKLKLLCSSCEEQFSVWEKAFSEKVFAPMNQGAPRVHYGPWMEKFAVSLSWRVLRAHMASGDLNAFPSNIVTAANEALTVWSDFLFDRRPHPGLFEQHLLFVGAIQSAASLDWPPNINRYLLRTLDPSIAHTGNSAITYAKLGRFLFFGFVAMPEPRSWSGTKVNVKEGWIGGSNVALPQNVGDFIKDRARLVAKRYSSISERQSEKIRESCIKDLDRVTNSETFMAMDHDVGLFGQGAFDFTSPSDERSRT
jgi:hypothetical protein